MKKINNDKKKTEGKEKWKTVVDFRKIKKGGVPVEDALKCLC